MRKQKHVKVTIEIEVALEPGYERDQDIKMSISDAVDEWHRREWRIHGRQPGQHGPGYPPDSRSGESVSLQYSEHHPTNAGKQWGTMKAMWEIK